MCFHAIVGSEEFAKRVRTVCLEHDGSGGPQTRADILAVVAEKFGTPVAVLRRRGRPENVAREVALLLCRE